MYDPQGISLGVGLTNDCNLGCAHCYRDTLNIDRLGLDEVRAAVDTLPVRSINLGTGENGLHPQFTKILDWMLAGEWKSTITSNGYTIAHIDDERLRRFANIEFSLDFPDEAGQDAFRGPGNWRLIEEQTKRCIAAGVPVTYTAVMMSVNFRDLAQIARVAADRGATFRVNLYQAVKTDEFSLTPAEVFEGYQRLFDATRLVTTTEPILAAALGLQPNEFAGCGCGRSTVRLTPTATVLPCVYWPESSYSLDRLVNEGIDVLSSPQFQEIRTIPDACQSCPHVGVCQGGCGGRRKLAGAVDEPDPFCPVKLGVRLTATRMGARDLPKSGSACTTIVEV